MKPLRVTLRGDGPTDDMLLPVVRWVLMQHFPNDVPIDPQSARWFAVSPRPQGLAEQTRVSLQLFPCDLLIVHRDTEGQARAMRVEEIGTAVAALRGDSHVPPHVCAIPARMSEAWLLFNEQAIRDAAANPKGKARLNLPSLAAVERLADPKMALREAITTASEESGRKLQKLLRRIRPVDVADYIDDFSPLRHLSAFHAFEDEIRLFAESWSPEE